MAIVLGIVQFGIVYNAKIIINSAAREGARKAAITTNDTSIQDTVKYAAGSLNITTIVNDPKAKGELSTTDKDALSDKTIWWYKEPTTGQTIGLPVTIYVRGKVNIDIPIINNLIGKYIIISSSATMRAEYGG
jgi:Flp pilus assembly protein TadG